MDLVQRRIPANAIIVAFAFLVVTVAILLFFPYGGIDWVKYFQPAAAAVLEGRSPYDVSGYYAPPWASFLLAPLAPLPLELSHAILVTCALFAVVALLRRQGASLAATVLFMFSPPMLVLLLTTNIDWLALCGLLLPPRWGLFLLALKPQAAGAVALVWVWEAWRADRLRGLWRLLWPITLATLVSFAVFGFWPATWLEEKPTDALTTIWPIGLPVGLGLAVLALQRRDERLACIASPFLSPHALMHSWVGAVLGISDNATLLAAVVAGQWIVGLLMA